MSFRVEGDYFEACSCSVSCPCIFLSPATTGNCDVFFVWSISKGQMDSLDLAGLNAALAVRAPKQMTEGNWTVALYLDSRADEKQADALGAIFSGQAGGHLANVAPLIGTVAGVRSASIEFHKEAESRSVKVGDVLEVHVEEIKGMDGKNPAVISNPLLGAVTQPLRQAKSKSVRFADDWSFSAEGTNGFITEFVYEG